MSERSKIEWTDHTFNPIRGCTKVSPGCQNCYAARDAKRFPIIRGIWGNQGTRILAVPSAWKEPLRWDRKARFARENWEAAIAAGAPMGSAPQRPRVFCASLADVFEDWTGPLHFPADISPTGQVIARWDGTQLVREFDESADAQGLQAATMDHARLELFDLIRRTPDLDWLLLTKRPENFWPILQRTFRLAARVPSMLDTLNWLGDWIGTLDIEEPGTPPSPPHNVWIGTTVEDQTRADQRIPSLLDIPARIRFLSCEPLLEMVNITCLKVATEDGDHLLFPLAGEFMADGMNEPRRIHPSGGIHWVIAGGESGPRARPMHPDWARSLRDQCAAAGVPFFFKQWGEWTDEAHANAESIQTAGASAIRNLGRDGVDNSTRDLWPPGNNTMFRICKKAAGRSLDGVEWSQFPAIS